MVATVSDSTKVFTGTTGSNRPVEFYVCGSLGEDPLEMDENETFKEKHFRFDRLDGQLVDHLVALAGGHARSLELLKETFDHYAHNATVTYSVVFRHWFRRFKYYNRSAYANDDIMLDLIARTLLNEQIKLADVIRGTSVVWIRNMTLSRNFHRWFCNIGAGQVAKPNEP